MDSTWAKYKLWSSKAATAHSDFINVKAGVNTVRRPYIKPYSYNYKVKVC